MTCQNLTLQKTKITCIPTCCVWDLKLLIQSCERTSGTNQVSAWHPRELSWHPALAACPVGLLRGVAALTLQPTPYQCFRAFCLSQVRVMSHFLPPFLPFRSLQFIFYLQITLLNNYKSKNKRSSFSSLWVEE